MSMWGGKPRLGEVNPEEAPYRNELALDNIEVFDLTGLKKAGDNAHDRAFEDVTSVVGMVKAEQMSDSKSISLD